MDQQEQPKKNGWGGRRANSGRKKTAVRSYTFYAPQAVVDVLDKVEGNKSEYICRCILQAAGEMKNEK